MDRLIDEESNSSFHSTRSSLCDQDEQRQQAQTQAQASSSASAAVAVVVSAEINLEDLRELSFTEEDPEASVTAAEPIDEDDEHCILHDSGIPTIRLSSLGTSLEKDFETVRHELGIPNYKKNSFDDGDDDDDNQLVHQQAVNGNHRHNNKDHCTSPNDDDDDDNLEQGLMMRLDKQLQRNIKGRVLLRSEIIDNTEPTSPSTSEEILMMEDQAVLSEQPPQEHQPRRQRLVSEDGIIAEFDPHAPISLFSSIMSRNRRNGPPPEGVSGENDNASNENENENNNSDNTDHPDGAKIVAEAIEIDSSFRDNSFRSYGDLELGDVEPLPYPGGLRYASSSIRSRAIEESSSRQDAIRALTSSSGQYGRPELISATVIKNSTTEHIGLNLLRDQTVIYSISHEEGSLLKDCPFQPGDKVLSINNKRTENMDSTEVACVLREATGFVNMVVMNPGGDPCLIETMISKANKNQRSGMGLKSTGDRDLRVSSINESGLFAQSLLNVGDRILSINGVDVTEVDARVACDVIKNAPNHVTVVARTRHTNAVVVAEVSSRGLHSSESVLAGIPEAMATTDNEIEAVDDTWAMNKRQREKLTTGVCIALIIVAAMVSIFGRGSQ